MSLFIASLNFLRLRSESRKARLDYDLQHLRVHVCALQVTRFHSGDLDVILSSRFDLFSVYYDDRSRVVSWLVSRSLKAVCKLVFTYPVGRFCVVDTTIKKSGVSFN